LESLKQIADKLLTLWSSDVLEIWIEVIALVFA